MSTHTPINLGVLAGARIPHLHTCKNGPAWAETARPNTSALAVAWLNGFFVVSNRAAAGGDHSGTVSYSTDGRNYTQSDELPIGLTFSVVQVAYGNGIFVANTNSSVSTAQAPSPSGPWTVGVNNPNLSKSTTLGMWFGNGQFVICNTSANIVASPDASNQVTHATPVAFNTGIYDDFTGLHLACDAASNDIYSSADLSTWVLRGSTTYSGGTTKRLITNGGGHLIALDNLVQRNFVSYSLDGGVTWLNSSGLPSSPEFYVDLLYVAAQKMWLLTNDNGLVFISHDDGANWVEARSSLNPILGSNQNWWMASTPGGFLYVAVPVTTGVSPVAAVGVC